MAWYWFWEFHWLWRNHEQGARYVNVLWCIRTALVLDYWTLRSSRNSSTATPFTEVSWPFDHLIEALFTLLWRNLKTDVTLWRHINHIIFRVTLCRRNLKTQQLVGCYHFRQALFSKGAPSTPKHKAGVFKFLRCEACYKSSVFVTA